MKSTLAPLILSFVLSMPAFAQIGQRFPSEKKVVPDPVTGVPLTFLTSTPAGDSKIYPTHPQWTCDGQWVVFRSNRVRGQAMAVNEQTGDIVQVTENGYVGSLCVGHKSMRLFHMRPVRQQQTPAASPSSDESPAARNRPADPVEIVAIDLTRVFADSAVGKMKPASDYEQVFGTVPAEIGGNSELAIDATEEVAYFRLAKEEAAKRLPEGTKLEPAYGPRHMGAGPSGVAKMDLKTGKVEAVIAVPFQVGHIQSNIWKPGEIVFCWETGGKSPQRTWTVNADGTGLRKIYDEQSFDWVTHEAVITPDEVAFAILGFRKPGISASDDWGACGTREHPTGLAIMNLRTREMHIAGQTPASSGFWHVHGSSDGRWAVGDDFSRNLYLIDRRTDELILLSSGHKETAADHPHPTFSPDGKKIEIQSAMLSKDGRSMNICIIPVPEAWLQRTYEEKVHPTQIKPGSV
jgi:oligogalacturonide lyase